MQQEKPLVGVLFSQEVTGSSARRFLAQIVAVDSLFVQENSDSNSRKAVIELNFPEQFKQRQGAKIKQLLKLLH
jgi:cellulose synthase (UDP-forming)